MPDLCVCDCGLPVTPGKSYRRGHNPRGPGLHRRPGRGPNGIVTPTFSSWRSMRQRCASHPHYVKRGVTVCDRWQSFEAFLADMGERPEGRTLDRIDNERGYEPGNCRWATLSEQNSNRRPWSKAAITRRDAGDRTETDL